MFLCLKPIGFLEKLACIDIYVEFSIMASVLLLGKLPQQFWALSATFSGKT